MSELEIFEQVYDIVRQIPTGKVTTYGRIARALDINPRYVGYILHNNPYRGDVQCHRVVNSLGKTADTFAFGGGDAQQKILQAEGVVFVRGHVAGCCIIDI